jgi:hypothetical protein
VFLSVLANREADCVFHFGSNGVFGGVHVCDLRMNQAFRESPPGLVGNVVIFTNVHTPDLARRLLKDSKKVDHLLVSHSFVKILHDKNNSNG